MDAFNFRPPRVALLALCLLLFPSLAATVRAAGQPVTVKELCLLLHGGYTGDEVLRETAGRPLLEPLDADAEKSLTDAGADARFIAALKSSHPALTDAQAADARAKQQAIDQRTTAARQAELTRLRQSDPAARGAPGVAAPASDPRYVENLLRDKLVAFEDDTIKPRSISSLQGKKLYGLYYSSYMSKEGRKFAPDLAQLYRRVQARHPEFEIVLISGDPTVFAMENMMRMEQMPWPALQFDQTQSTPAFARFIDPSGASRLMVVTGGGQVLADYRLTVANNNLLMVLPDLEKLVDNPTKPSVVGPPHMTAAPP